MKNTNSSQLRLSDELVDDILLCLPVKSLKRFKLVSKPWNSLISDPNFAQSHLNRSLRPNTNNICNLLRVGQLHVKQETGRRSKGSLSLSLYSMDSDGSNREVVRQDYDFGDGADNFYNSDRSNSTHCRILGSCNGLLLLSTIRLRYDIYQLLLWNPSIGKCKRIPHVRIPDDPYFTIISGLAYVSSSRNYKAILVHHQKDDHHEALGCNIYDYNLNCWTRKEYDAFPYRLHSDSSAIMVNGVPHWVVHRRRVDRSKPARRNYVPYLVSYLIVYFDSETEEFKKVGLPEWAAEEVKFDIGVLGGCLCMCLHPPNRSGSFDVWTMKKYGIAESWTKLFVISSPSFSRLLTPLCLMGKNQVLMKVVEKKKDEQKLVIFNLIEKTERIILFLDEILWWSVCTYVGSLVFPDQPPQQEPRKRRRIRSGRGYRYE